MADNKRNTSAYEKRFVMVLREAAAAGLTAQNLEENIFLFNDLFEAGYQFIERIALSKHRSWLASWQIEIEEAANVIATKLLFDNLDRFITHDNPIGYCHRAAENCVVDFVRKESHAKNDRRVKEKNGEEEKNGQTDSEKEERPSTANIYLSDAILETAPSSTNMEADYLLCETYLEMLDGLKQNDSLSQVVSFLGTKLLGYKPSELIQMSCGLGENALCQMVLRKALPSGLALDYWEDGASWLDGLGWGNYAISELPQKISKDSDRAKNKLRRSMCKTL